MPCLWVSPAVTASPYGKTLASSGAAVICGGTPLVIEKKEGAGTLCSLQFTHLTFKVKMVCVQEHLLFEVFE